MPRRLPLIALAVCALALARQAGSPSFDAAGRDAIGRSLNASVDRGDAAVIVAVVVNPGGEIYKGAFGTLDAKQDIAATADAIFRIASMTKAVTSVAAMMLVQEKRLQLDDPIDKYLGARPRVIASFNDVTKLVATSPLTSDITLRHLLTHTSGIAYAFSNDVMNRVREAASRIEETDVLVHEPGERWTYGPSTKLVGDIVSKISEQPLDVFFEERIFKPLGMVDTGFAVGTDKRARVATVRQRRDGELVEQPNAAPLSSAVRGDAGLFSTASDYGRFLRMLLNGGELEGTRLLDQATVRDMTTNQIGGLKVEVQPALNPSLSKEFPRGAGRDGWGFGFQIARPETADPKQRSAGSLSWSGVMNTYFWIDPTRKIAGVFLAQILPFGDEAVTRALDDFEAAVYANAK